jgi:thiol-disulfide isomerase/thioredoxin
MLELGTPMPAIALTDAVSGKVVTDRDVAGPKATLVMFICNHCPFVKHVLPEIGRIASEYAGKGVGFLAINPNDVVAYPQDGPEHMKSLATAQAWSFPFALDADQGVSRAFQAACTPDFFLFDAARRLAYRGRLDESRPGSVAQLSGKDLRAALEALTAGRPVDPAQRPSVGCSIKWRSSSPGTA